jgi:hypothetical protein
MVKKNLVRNVTWTLTGILLMSVFVMAITTITDVKITTPNITSEDWNNVTITESQITDLQSYLTSEDGDISNIVEDGASALTFSGCDTGECTIGLNQDGTGDCDAGNVCSSGHTHSTLYSDIKWGYNQTVDTHTLYNDVWISTYNATYDSKVSSNASFTQALTDTLYAELGVSGDNASWNQALAVTLFSDIKWGYNQTVDTHTLYNDAWTSTYNATYDASVGNASFTQALTDTLYAGIGIAEDNSSWNQALAVTLFSDIKWGYNQTVDTHTLYNDVWTSTYNATYDAKVTFPGYSNIALYNETNVFEANQNMSSNNLTTVDCITFNSGGKICSA